MAPPAGLLHRAAGCHLASAATNNVPVMLCHAVGAHAQDSLVLSCVIAFPRPAAHDGEGELMAASALPGWGTSWVLGNAPSQSPPLMSPGCSPHEGSPWCHKDPRGTCMCRVASASSRTSGNAWGTDESHGRSPGPRSRAEWLRWPSVGREPPRRALTRWQLGPLVFGQEGTQHRVKFMAPSPGGVPSAGGSDEAEVIDCSATRR